MHNQPEFSMIGPRIACYLPPGADPLSLVLPAPTDGRAAVEGSLPGWLGTGYRGNTNMWPRRFGEPTLRGNGRTPPRSIEGGVELTQAASGDESRADAGDADADAALGARARVHPETGAESRGVIVEDFGEMPDLGVSVSGDQIANPLRRSAVTLDDTLVLVHGEQITTINSLSLRTDVNERAVVNKEGR
jgi:hypothetical protein